MKFYHLVWILFSYLVNGDTTATSTAKVGSDEVEMMLSSCIGKSDGYYWLKLLEGDYPIVKIKCSNEYMMIDLSVDSNLQHYFSSFLYWHYALVGPTNDDHVSWDEWFLPAKQDNKGSGVWSHSEDCSVCLTTEEGNAIDEKQTTSATTAAENVYTTAYEEQGYYMSGNMYGCFWWYRGIPSCDLTWETYECNACAAGPLFSMEYHIGMCASVIDSVHREAEVSHTVCSKETTNKKPVVSVNSKFCMCYKPSTATEEYIALSPSQESTTKELEANVEGAAMGDVKEEAGDKTSSNNVIYLTQNDFLTGTYRIRYPGTYILKEDITVDFNAGDETDPKLGDWWPTADQADDYPGVGEYRNQYFLGFFAGITVEANDVVIDLNEKTMKLSTAMYYQQRWYSHIELASSFFQPGQGPGFFGSNFTSAERVTIKNGILDLSSHFGIHGNRNKDITITDVIVRNFEIAGIHLNGFEDVTITNVEIGPSSQISYLSGNFGHAQWALPRIANILAENPEASLTFDKTCSGESRVVYLQDVYDRIEEMLKRAYLYARFGTGDEAYDSDDDIWAETKEWFINIDGLPDGSAIHGLFLNSPGANVFTIGLSLWKSSTAKVENVYVHDLKNAPKHVVRIQNSVNFQSNPFNGPISFEPIVCVTETGEDMDWTNNPVISTLSYKGSTLTDMWFLLSEWETSWGPLQNTNIETGLRDWAVNGDAFITGWRLSCNADVMLHSSKGAIGIRLDGVDGVSMDNIKIEKLVNVGEQSSNACGAYASGYSGGHFLQVTPPQCMGYSGTYAYGMIMTQTTANLGSFSVSDIVSAYGLSVGIGIWHDNVVNIQDEWIIDDIRSGDYLEPDTLKFDAYPNNAAEACGVLVFSDGLVDLDDHFLDGVDFNDAIINYDNDLDENSIKISCVRSESTCRNKGTSTILGVIADCEYKSSTSWPEILDTKPLYAYPTEIDYKSALDKNKKSSSSSSSSSNNNDADSKNTDISEDKAAKSSGKNKHSDDTDDTDADTDDENTLKQTSNKNEKIRGNSAAVSFRLIKDSSKVVKTDNDDKDSSKATKNKNTNNYISSRLTDNAKAAKDKNKGRHSNDDTDTNTDITEDTKKELLYKKYELKPNPYSKNKSQTSSSSSKTSNWSNFSIILMLSVVLFAITYSIYICYKKSNNPKGYQKIAAFDNYGSTLLHA